MVGASSHMAERLRAGTGCGGFWQHRPKELGEGSVWQLHTSGNAQGWDIIKDKCISPAQLPPSVHRELWRRH